MSTIIADLYQIGAVQKGEFTLKSGEKSDIYIDLRRVPSYPYVLQYIVDYFSRYVIKSHIVPVPHGATPIASILAYVTSNSLLMLRKERKEHGTKKMIEGVYEEGDECILVEDVITTGGSVSQAIKELRDAGLKITKIFCICNRGKLDMIDDVLIHTLVTLDDIQAFQPPKFIQIAIEKRSRLILSADLRSPCAIIDLVMATGQCLAGVKLHTDIIDFDEQGALSKKAFFAMLLALKKEFNLFLIEDRKFADIGNTAKLQMQNLMTTKNDGTPLSVFDAVTAHAISGKGTIDGILAADPNVSIILVSDMSSEGFLADKKYIEECDRLCNQYGNVIGCVTQRKEKTINGYFFTPGIKLVEDTTPGINHEKKDSLGQRYNTPGMYPESDFFIVGRGIYQSLDPFISAKRYRDEIMKYRL